MIEHITAKVVDLEEIIKNLTDQGTIKYIHNKPNVFGPPNHVRHTHKHKQVSHIPKLPTLYPLQPLFYHTSMTSWKVLQDHILSLIFRKTWPEMHYFNIIKSHTNDSGKLWKTEILPMGQGWNDLTCSVCDRRSAPS